jgi:RND family efflux transporter MFP subunit
MKTFAWLVFGLLFVVLTGCEPVATLRNRPPAVKKNGPASVDPSIIEVPGRTQCAPGRKSLIAPVPLHPVVEVLVAPGDRVKKGQALVKIDDDEARADVRAKEAELTNARITLQESRRYLRAVEKLYPSGALPEQKHHEARVAALTAETKDRAAEAALDSARSELEHYVVTALIDGLVSSLDVYPGTVSRPGTTVWGEILDLGEIDVRCEVRRRYPHRVSRAGPHPGPSRVHGATRPQGVRSR